MNATTNDDLTTLIEYGARTPEGFAGHAIRFNPADVDRWESMKRNARKIPSVKDTRHHAWLVAMAFAPLTLGFLALLALAELCLAHSI